MAEKAPAFQFYPRDYLTDTHVRAMTYEQRGVYWEACALCWLDETLPNDADELAAILHLTKAQFGKLWPRIGACFIEEGGRLRHPRLDRERQAQADNKARRKAAADKRWHVDKQSKADAMHQQGTCGSGALECSASSSSSASATALSTRQEIAPARTATDDGFDAFWDAYPNHAAKADARKAWKKLKPSEALQGIILAAIADQKTWRQWCEGVVPHPATWLNHARWDDERPSDERRASVNRLPVNGTPWCDHQPACHTQQEHTARVLEDARATREAVPA